LSHRRRLRRTAQRFRRFDRRRRPGTYCFREGKRVVIIDPKQINDPLSEALASVAAEVHKLRDRVQQLEGAEVPYEPLPELLQRIMEDLDYQI
jgi:hypothetical protein